MVRKIRQWILRWLGIQQILERLTALERKDVPADGEKFAVPADVIGEWLQ